MEVVLLCIIYTFILYPITQGCNDSVDTVKFVDKCPVNNKEWTVRAADKACHLVNQTCTSPSNFQYHCLMNPSRDSYIEVCAPPRNLIGGFCPEFNLLGSRIQNNYKEDSDCKQFSPPCPVYYRSTDVYKYQDCFTSISKTQTTQSPINEKDVKKMSTLIYSRPTGPEPLEDNTSLTLPLGLGVGGAVILISVIIIIIVFVLKRGNSATRSTEDTKYSVVYSSGEKDHGN
ncbi:uncharacterized protein LOC133178601 [Saccostrea echinata]|uniref:uncharacterized protein LOC133178601 n=1 Tax=Saccostrea echinata TaxID=191078 RepID=UPI002A806F23|nr:uncharacterized protein LOC133178601 [Saccostrea echinata]